MKGTCTGVPKIVEIEEEEGVPVSIGTRIEEDEEIVAVVDSHEPWDGHDSGASSTLRGITPTYIAMKGREVPLAGKKKYKPTSEKKRPIAMEQPLDEEAYSVTELEDWKRRIQLRDERHEICPVITEDNLKDLDLPTDWSAEEMRYLHDMLLRCSKVFAWTERGKGRIDPRVVAPIKINVVEIEGFKFPAPRYNSRVTEEIIALLKQKVANGELERCSRAYSGRWFILRKSSGAFRWISDFQDLNSITIRDVGSVPMPEAYTEALCGRSIYSLLDAMGGYDQNYLDRRSRDLTAQ